jgi:site-specific DNA recombinase
MISVGIYARVSSEKQAQNNTIESQIVALENRVREDGHTLANEFKFIDNGYSGSNLIRPNLERLRDKAFGGGIDKIYIHSPDRLSRKYAYQMILMEEFQKSGVEVIFLNYQGNDSPESHLLLQMQGMIAEYERAKIIERHRRGKIHAAKKGCINILSAAPYGYRYIDKYTGGGQAQYEINETEAEVVRKIFHWFGRERLSIHNVCLKLGDMKISSPKGKHYWDRSVVWGILKNPAYKGLAAFGKTKIGNRLQNIRPQKHSSEQPKRNYSVYNVDKESWIYVPVPAIIDESVFEVVQEQLTENQKVARVRRRGAVYLLQGLLECKRCHYAFYGKPVRNKRREKIDSYAYYRCIGTDAYRFGGNRICNNKQMRTDALETVVWEEVKALLRKPDSILTEYQRRITEIEKSPEDQTVDVLEKQANKLKRGISRLIDSYAQEHISSQEFEPRVKIMKKSLDVIEEQKKKVIDQKKLRSELKLIVTNLEGFASTVELHLEDSEWTVKRDIIRTLVKRVEIDEEEINIVFRIKELPPSTPAGEKSNLRVDYKSLQYCCESRCNGIHTTG